MLQLLLLAVLLFLLCFVPSKLPGIQQDFHSMTASLNTLERLRCCVAASHDAPTLSSCVTSMAVILWVCR